MRARHNSCTNTSHDRPRKRGVSSSNTISKRARDKDIASPSSQVVDGSDKSFLRSPFRSGLDAMKRLDEAWVNEDSCEDTDIVTESVVSQCSSTSMATWETKSLATGNVAIKLCDNLPPQKRP